MGDNFGEAIGITVFDVSFFVIITVIGLNIVLGIIVDTFSQLRDAKVYHYVFF
jgi:inositol 1,4,5-triphosphate receptor type 1